MSEFGWALIGPGRIAGRFVEALGHVPGEQLRAVFGRDCARAAHFIATQVATGDTQPRVVSQLRELLDDPLIDGVYIATPHAKHGELVRQCLLAGKPVLRERPLVPSLAQGNPLVKLADERRVFLMEAVWTRFLPVYETVSAWLRAGAIGALRSIQSSFCFPARYEAAGRLYNPALAGGALFDIGIYNLTMTRWVVQQALGACAEPASIQATGVLAPTGVDARVSATLAFHGSMSSQFVCGFDGRADNSLTISGERGYIKLPAGFWRAIAALLHRPGEVEQRVHAPFRCNGFENKREHAQHCNRAGSIESPAISHLDTLTTLGWMDEIRRQVGVRYPFEESSH